MKTIAIVGLGVIGGSFAKAIAQHLPGQYRVLGIDTDPETLALAKAEGWIEEGELENKTILQEADIVILGLYPQAMKDFLIHHQKDFKPGALVTDTAGVKASLLDDGTSYIPEQVDFIMGHPMAGRENRGIHYADPSVFQDANYLLTPTENNDPKNIGALAQFLESLGFKRVTITSPQSHDKMIAFTSQLCHVIAVSLINSDSNPENTVRYIGDSYRDLTRIAKINEDLWSELFLENKAELLAMMQAFKDQFDLMENFIQKEDRQGLAQLFKESTKRRIQLETDDHRLQERDRQ